jgi:hypothetical protein
LDISTLFAIEPPTAKAIPMPQTDSYGFFDPALLRAAKEIYARYCQISPDPMRRRQPIGVAIDKLTHRGKLIFSSYPVLLPEECFISTQELETDFN